MVFRKGLINLSKCFRVAHSPPHGLVVRDTTTLWHVTVGIPIQYYRIGLVPRIQLLRYSKGRDGCILLRYLRSKIYSRIQGIRRENPKNPRNPGAESEESRGIQRIRRIRERIQRIHRESEESRKQSSKKPSTYFCKQYCRCMTPLPPSSNTPLHDQSWMLNIIMFSDHSGVRRTFCWHVISFTKRINSYHNS